MGPCLVYSNILSEQVLNCHLNGRADVVGRHFLHSFPILDPLPLAIFIFKICKRKLLTCLIKITKQNLDKYMGSWSKKEFKKIFFVQIPIYLSKFCFVILIKQVKSFPC